MMTNVGLSLTDHHDEDYDEMEVDLRPGPSNTSNGIGTPIAGSSVAPGSSGSIGRRRVLRRGERCGRCFRRRWIRVVFRLINSAFALIFLASAALQYNDPAGVLWAAVYLFAAVFCTLSELSWRQLRTYFVLPTLWLYTACTTIGALYVLIADLLIRRPSGGASSKEAYDFWGLVIVSFWMSIVLLLDRHHVVGIFRGYSSLGLEHERDKEGHVQMGEVVL